MGEQILVRLIFKTYSIMQRPQKKQRKSWDDVPEDVKNTFDKLGIPEAEKKFLAGVGAQYESEVVYHSLREDLQKQGVLFTDTDTALKEHPELMKKYFGKIIPPEDNKFAAWIPIIGRTSNTSIFLDGFAGPGIYENNELGSPIIALETAQDHSDVAAIKNMKFIFIEKDKDRHDILVETVKEKYADDLFPNITYEIMLDDFVEKLSSMLKDIQEKNEFPPTLALSNQNESIAKSAIDV